METFWEAITSNNIGEVKDWLIENREDIGDLNLYNVVRFAKKAEMFSTISYMCGEEILAHYKKHQRSILNHAIQEGKDFKFLKEIISFDKGCINRVDSSGLTPFMNAVLNKNIGLMKFLLQNDADVNFCNRSGESPLHFAQTLEVVKFVIENGGKINCTNNYGSTPIMTAINNERDRKIILEFISNDADVEVCNKRGQTCLHLALYFKYDEYVIDQICSKTRDYKVEDNNGLTPLCYALNNENGLLRPSYEIYFIHKLINNGFVVYNKVFMNAVKYCENVNLIASLTQYVNLECFDYNGNCVVHLAQNVKLINILVRRGAPINHENKEGKTPLTHAVIEKKSIDIINSLLSWGSDIKKLVNFLQDCNYNIYLIPDSVYDLLIFNGMSVSLKNNFVKRFLSPILNSAPQDLPRILYNFKNYGLLRHIFVSNGNVMIPDDIQIKWNRARNNIFKIYDSELNKMKDKQITNNVSYYNFCRTQYKIMRSPFFYQGITKEDYENIKKQFPAFFNEIVIKIKINIKINKRKKLLYKLINVFLAKQIEQDSYYDDYFSTEYFGLDCDSIYKVGCFLSTQEINCLLAAAVSSPKGE